MTPHNSAASRAVFLIPKISHIIRHCKFVLQGGCFFLKKLKRHVLFKLEQRTRRRKNVSLNRVFSQVGQCQRKNAHGRTCKKIKVDIYLNLSLYENLFEKGCIYIYICIHICVVFCIVWVLKYREESNGNDKKAIEILVLFRYYRTEKPRQCFCCCCVLSHLFSLVTVFKNPSLGEFAFIWQIRRNGHNSEEVRNNPSSPFK